MKHSISIKELHASDYANLVLLNQTYSIQERNRWNRVRVSFLEEQLRKYGKLVCHYCGRGDLKLNARNQNRQATVDHVKPVSKGGNEFDNTNFVVSCRRCNSKKGCSPLEEFVNGRYLLLKKKHPIIEIP